MMWLMLMSKVIRPGVIHVSRVEPARVQHEWIKTSRMSISKIWKKLKEKKQLNRCALIMMKLNDSHMEKRVIMLFNDFYGAARDCCLENENKGKIVFQKIPTMETRNFHVIKLNSFVYALRWKNFCLH